MHRRVSSIVLLIPVVALLCGCSLQETSDSQMDTPIEHKEIKIPEPPQESDDLELTNRNEISPTPYETKMADASTTPSPVPASGDQEEVVSINLGDEVSSPKIIVKKSERVLELWDGDHLYGSYSIGLGWEPIGDKKIEGDGRTPQGTYYVCTRNDRSRFYLSLGVSYPNKEDAKEALEEGTIDQSTYEEIADAIDGKSQPPWYTAMGGEIMIHGMGGDSDWTAGCIAVDNEVMDILWEFCPTKTPIIIEP